MAHTRRNPWTAPLAGSPEHAAQVAADRLDAMRRAARAQMYLVAAMGPVVEPVNPTRAYVEQVTARLHAATTLPEVSRLRACWRCLPAVVREQTLRTLDAVEAAILRANAAADLGEFLTRLDDVGAA